jgi:hypothetical protein
MADDAESCSFWNEKVRKARKSHKCHECGRLIAAGEFYRHCVWIGDGEFGHSNMCTHCDVGAEWLRKNCGGFLTHAIAEDIDQHVDEYAYLGWPHLAGLGRLSIGMRRDWKIVRGPHAGQLMPIPRLPPAIDERNAR